MRRVRDNLSRIKGMNVNSFAHADNEVNELINLKPSSNGLEMRNGAREVYSDRVTKLVENKYKGRAICNDGLMEYGDSFPVQTNYEKFQLIRPLKRADTTKGIYDTNFGNVFISEDPADLFTIGSNVAVLFDGDDDVENQSLNLWLYNPELKSIVNGGLAPKPTGYSMGTHLEAEKYVLDNPLNIHFDHSFNEVYYGALDDQIDIVDSSGDVHWVDCHKTFKKSKRGGISVSLASATTDIWTWKTSKFKVWGEGKDIKVRYNTTTYSLTIADNIEDIWVHPIEQVSTENNDRYGSDENCLLIFVRTDAGKIDGYYWSSGYIAGPSSITTVGTALTLDSGTFGGKLAIGDFIEADGQSIPITAVDPGDAAATLDSAFSSDLTGEDYYILKADPYIEAISSVSYTFKSNFKDVECIGIGPSPTLYSESTARHLSLNVDGYNYYIELMFLYDDGTTKTIEHGNFKIFRQEETSVLTQNLSIFTLPSNVMEAKTYDSDAYNFDKIESKKYIYSEFSSLQGGDDKIEHHNYVMLHNNVDFYRFNFEYIFPLFDYYSMDISFMFNKNIFPLSSGNIIDVKISPAPSWSMKLNQHIPPAIRPYFGETVDTDTVAAAVPAVDLYTIPVLEGYDLPIDVNNATSFTPTGTGVTTRWLSWLFYIFPQITIESSATSIRFAKGEYDDDGIYRVRAWTEEGEDGRNIDKSFDANIFSPDSIVLFNAKRGALLYEITQNYSDIFSELELGVGDFTIGVVDDASTGTQVLEIDLNTSTSGSRGIISDEQFDLEEGEWYTIELALKWTSGTNTVNLGIYEGDYAENNGKSLNQNISVTTSWVQYTYTFKAANKGSMKIALTTAVTGQLYVRDIKMYAKNPFIKQIAWNDYKNEVFAPMGYSYGVTFNCTLDHKTDSVYLTSGGVLFHNKGASIPFPSKPISIKNNDIGFWVVTEFETYLIEGYTPASVNRKKMLDHGISKDNENGVAAFANTAVIFNDTSIFLFNNNQVYDIGVMIEPYISSLTGPKYVTINEIDRSIWVPIDISAIENITVLDADNGDITYNVGYAIYDVSLQSWRIYGYHDDTGNESENFISYSSIRSNIIGNVGSKLVELEVPQDYARDTQGYTNESWDKMIGKIRTKEISFGDPTTMSKMRWLNILIRTLRSTIINYNYINMDLIQNYSPYIGNPEIIVSIEKDNLHELYPGKLNFSIPVNKQVYSAVIEITVARTLDSENPKVIIRDMIPELVDTTRRRRGGW